MLETDLFNQNAYPIDFKFKRGLSKMILQQQMHWAIHLLM
jgi:hypothetical protein